MRVLSFCLAACATLCGGFGVPHVNTVEARRIALAAPRAHAVRLVDDASQALEEEGEAAMAAVAAVLAENRAAAEAIASAQAEPAEAEMPQKSRLPAVDVDLCLALSDADQHEIEAEANEVFEVIDRNSDGLISKDELCQHLKSSEYSAEEIDLMFDSLDVNADGYVSRQEMQQAFKRFESASLRLALGLVAGPSRQRRRAESASNGRLQMASEIFELIDVNGDSEISMKELRSHLAGRGYSQDTVDTIFSLIDLNSDGVISREELCRCFEQYEYSALRLALGIRTSSVADE